MKLLIKLGGTLLDSEESRYRLALEITGLAWRGHQVVVVHGGGKQLSRYLTERGIESRFVKGLRVTTPETLDAVVKVLTGEVNLALVSAFQQAGARAVGLTGADAGLVHAVRLSAELGAVGRVERVRPELLELLTSQGYLPVVACLAGGDHGAVYNVNADQMAVACAVYFMADRLIFLTDVPGVKDADGLVIRWLDLGTAAALTQKSIIAGGMLPKLQACKDALMHGVNRVRILPAAEVEALPEFYFAKIESGTEVLVA